MRPAAVCQYRSARSSASPASSASGSGTVPSASARRRTRPAHHAEEHVPVVGGGQDAEALPAGVAARLAQARAGPQRHQLLPVEPADGHRRVPEQALARVDHGGQALVLVQHVQVLAQQRRGAPGDLGRFAHAGLQSDRDHPRVDDGSDAPGGKAQHHSQRHRHVGGQRLHQRAAIFHVEAQEQRRRERDRQVPHDPGRRVRREMREAVCRRVRVHFPQHRRRDGGRQGAEDLTGHLRGRVLQDAGSVGGVRLHELRGDAAEHFSAPRPPAPTRSR